MSQIRQNFHSDCESGINKQINMELYASYVYLAMSSYFNRDDVALPGFTKYFQHQSDEEREHAQKLMKYQNKRGGRLVLQPIQVPDKLEWTPITAFEDALALEKKVNQSLLDLHKVADGHGDSQMTDFLEGEYLEEQVDSIKEIGDHLTNLQRNGDGLGVYLYDKHTLQN